MAKRHPEESRRDVVALARRGDIPIGQIARDFGVSDQSLRNWLKGTDVQDGVRPGATSAEAAELREARKHVRVLEQEVETLRRAAPYFAREISPK